MRSSCRASLAHRQPHSPQRSSSNSGNSCRNVESRNGSSNVSVEIRMKRSVPRLQIRQFIQTLLENVQPTFRCQTPAPVHSSPSPTSLRRFACLRPTPRQTGRARARQWSPVAVSSRNARRHETQQNRRAHERTHSFQSQGTPEVLLATNIARCVPKFCRKQAANKADPQYSWLLDTLHVIAGSTVLWFSKQTTV